MKALTADEDAELVGVGPVAGRLVSDPGPAHQSCPLTHAEPSRRAIRGEVLGAAGAGVLTALAEDRFVIGCHGVVLSLPSDTA